MNVKRNIVFGLAVLVIIPAVLWGILALKPGDKVKNSLDNATHISGAYIKLLHTGNVVLRTGNDATSEIIRNMNRVNKTYSHAGIVVVEHGYPFIYHCIGGENNWINALHRDSFSRFVSRQNNRGFAIIKYDLDSGQVNNMIAAVKNYCAKQPSFDLDFDLRTDDKLYCSELVYKVLVKATRDTDYIATTTLKGVQYVAIDNLFTNKHASVVCELRY